MQIYGISGSVASGGAYVRLIALNWGVAVVGKRAIRNKTGGDSNVVRQDARGSCSAMGWLT